MNAFMMGCLVATSTGGLEGWVAREVEGRGRLPALSEVLREADAELQQRSVSVDDWLDDARDRAWIPDFDARFGTDRSLDVRDATTSSWVRTGEGFGVQVRLRWSLGDALFNDGVLRVEKAVREQENARRRVRDRLVKLYFQRLEVEVELLRRPSLKASVQAARIDGQLRAATGGRIRFGRRSHNPWRGVAP